MSLSVELTLSPGLNNQKWKILKQTKEIMGNLLYTVAVILLIIWAIGFIGYNAGGVTFYWSLQ